jgi:hypothetical protein
VHVGSARCDHGRAGVEERMSKDMREHGSGSGDGSGFRSGYGFGDGFVDGSEDGSG